MMHNLNKAVREVALLMKPEISWKTQHAPLVYADVHHAAHRHVKSLL